MSNRTTIQKTVFVNYLTQSESYGYIIYDDYQQEFCNTMPKENLDLPTEEFLKCAITFFGDVAVSILDHALDNGGIFINNTWNVLVLAKNEEGWEFGKKIKKVV